MHGFSKHKLPEGRKDGFTDGGVVQPEPLPYGTQHIDPIKCVGGAQWLFAEFVLNSKGLLTRKLLEAAEDIHSKKNNSNDPAVRMAFASRLDSETRGIQDRQVRPI